MASLRFEGTPAGLLRTAGVWAAFSHTRRLSAEWRSVRVRCPRTGVGPRFSGVALYQHGRTCFVAQGLLDRDGKLELYDMVL